MIVRPAGAVVAAAAAASLTSRLRCSLVEPEAIRRLDDGLFYNENFYAHNIWEIKVDEALLDEAAGIFWEGQPFASLLQPGEPYADLATPSGLRFFAQRVTWDSDISWISTDDMRSYEAFESIFERMRLPELFAPVVPHRRRLRMYNAFFVCRTKCAAHDFHVDYHRTVGTSALTLIAPLRDYKETDSFQLSYKSRRAAEAATSSSDSGIHDDGEKVRRYPYKKGRAVVFSSGFEHSTEPGCGQDGEPHVYLCFTFGTDQQEAWPEISKTLGTQSRVVMHPDGVMRLSQLGEGIEEAVAAAQHEQQALTT